jgi:hypothetical protein
MSASKYLPPFTSDERAAVGGHPGQSHTPADPARSVSDPEATYADFLGDEVED